MTEPLRLVVVGDSTAFTDHEGPQLPTAKHLYPNVVAGALEAALQRPVSLNVLARAGMDVREAWKLVMKDRHAQFEVLMGADAVIVAIGSIDHGPQGTPVILEAIVPYLRPAWLRRGARRSLRRFHPWGVRLTGARAAHTPGKEFARLYDALLLQVRALTQGAPGVVMGPTSHSSRFYGLKHPRRAEREEMQFAIALRHGFPTVPSWSLVEPYRDRLNPDGVHWPPEAHAAVGERLAADLIGQLRGEAPKPRKPW